jgi:hypothetical protein
MRRRSTPAGNGTTASWLNAATRSRLGGCLNSCSVSADEIEIFYLPAYAPEHNPDEYLTEVFDKTVSIPVGEIGSFFG